MHTQEARGRGRFRQARPAWGARTPRPSRVPPRHRGGGARVSSPGDGGRRCRSSGSAGPEKAAFRLPRARLGAPRRLRAPGSEENTRRIPDFVSAGAAATAKPLATQSLPTIVTSWRNGSASDSRSEGCVFKSRRGQDWFFSCGDRVRSISKLR